MSDPLRVALVAEGPTDGIVIEAAIRSILGKRPFVLKQIFPEGSSSFGTMGAGWVGVYRWCHQAALRGSGCLSGDGLLFLNYDVLILHLDADVAGFDYADGSLTPTSADSALMCAQKCPPPSATTNALRPVLLSWCGETNIPDRTVICMPSKSTEAWVVASLFPRDPYVRRGIECYANAEGRLGQQPHPHRIRKAKVDYQDNATKFTTEWPRIVAILQEASRFQTELLAVIPP